jgi:hypothetical protein
LQCLSILRDRLPKGNTAPALLTLITDWEAALNPQILGIHPFS